LRRGCGFYLCGVVRPLRLLIPEGIYHVTSRGNARGTVFRDDLDRVAFLELLALVVDRFGWICHAYCLMGNHYHLLVQTPQPNLSSGMRQLNGVYAQRFNRRQRRVGHLFQARFGAKLVEKEASFLGTARYLVLNPVRAAIVERPAAAVLRNPISQLRRLLAPHTLSTEPSGYLLRLEPDELDADRFDRLAGEGRAALVAGRFTRTSSLLAEALAVWRGPPLADFAYDAFAKPEIARPACNCCAEGTKNHLMHTTRDWRCRRRDR
jgi:REP element-mobilizing transposase RayT